MRRIIILCIALTGCPEDGSPVDEDARTADARTADARTADGTPPDAAPGSDAAPPRDAAPGSDAAPPPVDAAPGSDAAPPVDAAPGSDAAPAVDAAPREDAAPVDAAPVDAAPVDAAPVDAAPVDAAPADAAPRDAAPDPPDLGPNVDNPLGPRPGAQTCQLPEAPALGGFRAVRAFANLSFNRPLWLGTAPGDRDTIFVVEQGGRIYAFDDRQDVRQNQRALFLDVDASRAGNEEGLLGLAFHPDYAENGRFFVYYSGSGGQCNGGARCSIISEFRRAERRRADPMSERIVLRFNQPFSNHNGGDIHFGPDGHLYISVGDGGSGGDPLNSGQDTSTLLGNILRIDIDDPPEPGMGGGGGGEPLCTNECRFRGDGDCDDGGPNSDFDLCAYGSDCDDCGPRDPLAEDPIAYRIPPGNPFADGVGGRPEIYAWGLRNVWRMSFDPSTGALWAGDVGQNAREEIDKIVEPGNFGWNTREGDQCFRGDNCPCPGCIDPIHAYANPGLGRSVTGGVVYRGPRLPELWGRYLFADFVSGRAWSLLERPGQAPRVDALPNINQPSSFGTDADGRVYITSFGNSSIIRLDRQNDPPGDPIPQRLSDTGCFADTAALTLAPSVVPYDLNVPFWSDGAEKGRAIALPAGRLADYAAEGPFDFPVGTVFIKTFTIRLADGSQRRLETRMYARQQAGWRGFTWKWNDAQDDAVLLDGALDEEIRTPAGVQTWHYPSRAECDQCHTEAAGFALGWRAGQLNRRVAYPRGAANQLEALDAAGYLNLPGPVADQPAWPRTDDADAPVQARVRALLDANCAMCHQPAGPGNAQIDLRFETPFADTGMCNGEPTQGDFGLVDPRIVRPGAPARSMLLVRMALRGDGEMPPVASNLVDADAVQLLRGWIAGLQCP